MREAANPGCIKLPQGAKDREKILDLESRVAALEMCVNPEKLESAVRSILAAIQPPQDPDPSKDELVARAAELNIGAPSTLARWGVEKLKSSIAEAEKEV